MVVLNRLDRISNLHLVALNRLILAIEILYNHVLNKYLCISVFLRLAIVV